MKTTITRRIILSYLLLIFISLSFIAAFFTLAARGYVERQVQNNLEKAAEPIRRVLKENLNELKKESTGDGTAVESNKALQSIRDIIKRSLVIQGTSYAIIGKDQKILYPSSKSTEEYEKLKNQILPAIGDKAGKLKENRAKFSIENVEYVAVILPIPTKADSPLNYGGWVILYTAIEQVNKLGEGVMAILVGALVFTGVMAVIIGVVIARSIASPIIKLRKRAELLSQRDFDTKVEIKTGDEIEELAYTFNGVAAELKEYDMGQKKFLQNASHELKTPLMSIQGYAEGLKDGVFDDREQALDVIIEESNRLKKIVEELIFLSKLETMEGYYNFQPESMNEIIEKSIEKVASIAMKKCITVSPMLYRDATVSIDRDKFTQALINILGNCLQYAESEVCIVTANDGRNFEIRIFDNGEGFDEKDMSNIFERFYKGKKGNTGLGLAITKVIIEKHCGSIKAFNRPKGGAEFIVTLPIK